MVEKTPDLLFDNRMSRAGLAVFLSFCIAFALAFVEGGIGIIALPIWAAFLIWVASTVPKGLRQRAAYMLDGRRVCAKTFPINEYRSMDLWEERVHEISGLKPCDWEFPSAISEDQAKRLYQGSPPIQRLPWENNDF